MINFEQCLQDNCGKWKDREYVFEKKEGCFQAVSYGDFLDNVRGFAKHLLSLGLAGKNIMVYGENSSAYMVADLAVLQYVGVSVCVSKEWKAKEVLRAIRLLDVSCVIFGPEKKEIIEEVAGEFPQILLISMDSVSGFKSTEIPTPREDDICCKIVFSSGTTAMPKAVMLSKRNLFAGLDSLYKRCPFNEEDVDYLFLPLSHTYAGIYNFLYSLVFGFQVYLCSGMKELAGELLEVNPTIFCGVPVIYRKLYEAYGSKLAYAFGNRMKYLFCGGALFAEDMRQAYKDSGLNMMEAYALSETASTFAIQYPYDSDVKTVGTVAEDIEVKVLNPDENGVGEIVVRGDNVFLGYANDEALTASVFTEDGFFKTGDLGYLLPDEEHGGNRLYITGRKKKELIGENGENIEPTHIEKMICEKDANINKALLYLQDGKVSCHIYLMAPEDRDWENFFEEVNNELSGFERIRHYDVMTDSVENRLKQ